MKFFPIILFAFFIPNFSSAQTVTGKLIAAVSVEDMYSTHATHFPGISAGITKRLSKTLSAGAGIEYSHSGFHDDNGWNLYNLNFIPVYLAQNLYFFHLNKFEPYLRLQEGISFISFDKEYQDAPGPRTHLKEKGFYGYCGLGSDYRMNEKAGVFLEAGLKSFHISGNALEVNPHGINVKLGLKYSFR